MDHIAGEHWLYNWIDEYEIASSSMLDDALKIPGAIDRLQELIDAELRAVELSPSDIPSYGAVIAGLGLDLMSTATCHAYECRAAIADSEFSQVLHYFDAVVMEGPSASGWGQLMGQAKTREEIAKVAIDLMSDIDVMLHLRRIGLANYIIFGRRNDCFCEEHLHEHARSLDVAGLIDDEALLRLAKDISKNGRVAVDQTGPREWFGYFREPDFVGCTGIEIKRKTQPKKHEVALALLRRHLDETVFDAALARKTGSPLASLAEPSLFVRGQPESGLRVEDVALRVHIPMLLGLSTTDFIRLREYEYDHFKRFQDLTREAIQATINEAATRSPDEAADIVWQTKIRPQLNDLEVKIANSKSALTQKLVAGASFGGASAAIGSLIGAVAASAGSPLATLIGVAVGALGTVGALPTALPFIVKNIEEKQQFKGDGAYFLWKATKAWAHK